ncbi:MAG: hypothetical protein BWY36_00661 [Candidatus Diapherotrites archaeon ADurb.Bin253]|mgnify:FL=1|jgi:hypothetical protein|nr:hypothetical protein [Candidatus Pacearchaeota archaeon]OQA67558.1 MAG: hypothetical protein BWY36_00661 [Candidatus Diapherotrites archaeon ADurb.Bin253]HNZ52331.1 hypothetical protein [Candidatus Pacearchaeota archaeon]HOH04407.1 hypothetical protein [Candidatus Pacearchaeota archaeon]
MPIVNFLFEKEKDAWNIWNGVNEKIRRFGNPIISPKITAAIKDKFLEESIPEIKRINQTIYDSGLIENFIESLQKSWEKIEKEFFRRIETITGKNFNGDVSCFITTIGTCPYNPKERWFMSSLLYNLPKSVVSIGHELLHIHFHDYYFEDIEKQIGTEKTHDLREALTVLLNLEFKDLLIGFDEGYEQHRELREFIIQEWKKEKNFDKLLEKCIVKLCKTNDFIKK